MKNSTNKENINPNNHNKGENNKLENPLKNFSLSFSSKCELKHTHFIFMKNWEENRKEKLNYHLKIMESIEEKLIENCEESLKQNISIEKFFENRINQDFKYVDNGFIHSLSKQPESLDDFESILGKIDKFTNSQNKRIFEMAKTLENTILNKYYKEFNENLSKELNTDKDNIKKKKIELNRIFNEVKDKFNLLIKEFQGMMKSISVDMKYSKQIYCFELDYYCKCQEYSLMLKSYFKYTLNIWHKYAEMEKKRLSHIKISFLEYFKNYSKFFNVDLKEISIKFNDDNFMKNEREILMKYEVENIITKEYFDYIKKIIDLNEKEEINSSIINYSKVYEFLKI